MNWVGVINSIIDAYILKIINKHLSLTVDNKPHPAGM
jgi:hypothetical protein